jgi:hypothetical protein
MCVRADIGGPLVVGLGAIDHLQARRHRHRAGIGDALVGGEPRGEGFADEADQRAHPQRQERYHLLGDTEPRGDVLRIDRSGFHALIEQERRDADDDMRALEFFRIAAHRGPERQRLAGVIGDVDGRALRLADQLRGEVSIDLIDRAALAAKDQFRPRLQQRQFDSEQHRHIVVHLLCDGEQSGQRRQPHQCRQRQRAHDPLRRNGLNAKGRPARCKGGIADHRAFQA